MIEFVSVITLFRFMVIIISISIVVVVDSTISIFSISNNRIASTPHIRTLIVMAITIIVLTKTNSIIAIGDGNNITLLHLI